MIILSQPADPRAARARELRVDRLLPKLFFSYSLEHYVSWTERDDKYKYVLITHAETIKDGIHIDLCGERYEITSKRSHDYEASRTLVTFQLSSASTPLFSAAYVEIGEDDDLIVESVDSLAEGSWVGHFRALAGEITEWRRAQEWSTDEPTDDEFYLFTLALSEPGEVKCSYGHQCPLVGSLRTLQFTEGPAQWKMCDYHWSKFVRTLDSVSDDAAPKPTEGDHTLGHAKRPRRCEWSGCFQRVSEYVEVPSSVPAIPSKIFFCETHRPAFLHWFADRSQPISRRLSPALRRSIYLWLATRTRWQRLSIVLSSILALLIFSTAAVLTAAVWDTPTYWVVPLLGIATWVAVSVLIYWLGTLAAWVWRGFGGHKTPRAA